MIVYGVLVGFLAVAGGVLLCVFPGQRARLAAAWRGFAVMGGAPVSRFSRRLGGALLARPAHAAGAVLLVAAPTLLVFGLRGPAIFDFGDEERMTERQIAVRWKVSLKTLRRWRLDNEGPLWHKLFHHVRYHEADILEFERQSAQHWMAM